jgi:hypothetical protein
MIAADVGQTITVKRGGAVLYGDPKNLTRSRLKTCADETCTMPCALQSFGADPAPYTPKVCLAYTHKGYEAHPEVVQGDAGKSVTLKRGEAVFYGNPNNITQSRTKACTDAVCTIPCALSSFGADPAPYIPKVCITYIGDGLEPFANGPSESKKSDCKQNIILFIIVAFILYLLYRSSK